ncbi:peroxide stress protein YaaA [Bacteriovorax sp. DB6_IX]|uniref:peroxide stress protein YaaA n=1 Tax=Bacteriovorax sp. DB6_IX TaxID=1353530 RepID=UPI000389FD17|nr:peroxide stress protein YaaA [Bacteriovorax sp. DB6_IX]EQC51335.1 PF03883 family protein [Bacteriovorax sp. DB6_IX]
MNIVISPAKKLDFEHGINIKCTKPLMSNKTSVLLSELQKCKMVDIQKMMKLSDKLAQLNFERYQEFEMTADKSPAIYAFVGDTYKGLDAKSYSSDDLAYAQEHLHILSGLYGLLRPYDEMKPYRLEMGTKFGAMGAKNLYEFWGSDIVKQINKFSQKTESEYLVNLASEEYFKSVKRDELEVQVIDVKFLENKNGQYKMIGLMAKRARGMMASYIVKNQIKSLSDLKKFDVDGYKFSKEDSEKNLLVFKR